jgi:hypothetical protein
LLDEAGLAQLIKRGVEAETILDHSEAPARELDDAGKPAGYIFARHMVVLTTTPSAGTG